MKKAKFKYNVGQSVKFRFYDGSVHEGKIQIAQYRNSDVDYLPTEYSQPMYTCHVPDNSGNYSRGYMVYTVTENMVKDKSVGDIKIIPLENYIEPVDVYDQSNESLLRRHKTKVSSEFETLDQAIEKQKEFINGKVKN